jgi:hypothetical protein
MASGGESSGCGGSSCEVHPAVNTRASKTSQGSREARFISACFLDEIEARRLEDKRIWGPWQCDSTSHVIFFKSSVSFDVRWQETSI